MKMNIHITKTIFGKEEVTKIFRSRLIIQSPNVAKFQKIFSQFTVAHCFNTIIGYLTVLHLDFEVIGLTNTDKDKIFEFYKNNLKFNSKLIYC